MNAKDRYNRIIEEIEKRIQEGGNTKPAEIAETVSKMVGIDSRELSIIFSFMTNQPLIQYIRTRQLMAAYRSILESAEFDIEGALSFTGFGDQPAFNKAFRKCFGITPGKVFEEKNEQLYKPAMTWEVVSDLQAENERGKEEDRMDTEKMFGMEMGTYQRITEAMEYQAMYGFTPVQANAAFELATATGLPLKGCFEFVDDYCLQFYADDDGNIVIEDEDFFKEDVLAGADFARLCVNFDFSIQEGRELIEEINCAGVDLSQLTPNIISTYLKGSLGFRAFWKAYNFGIEHGVEQDDMPEFLSRVSISESLQDALESYLDWIDSDYGFKYLGEEDERDYVYLDKEEINYYDYDRFEKDYDIDNMGYEDDDISPIW